ncbi:MAG: extracellular solute-binding protein, partial [Proteobacteria bacterium]|nr:extracellular solute-binding protein [Pseudomonadota bacterium]
MKCVRRFLFGCLTTLAFGSGGPAFAGGELFIYNWSDYTPTDLIQKFEKETGVKVTVDTYDSMETLLAKLKSGAKGYDITIVTSDFVPIFRDQGLIQKLNISQIPEAVNIEERFTKLPFDPGNEYTIPYDWGSTAFMINTKNVTETADSLKLLFDPPQSAKGKVGMFSSPGDVVALAELYLGLPFCQTDTANMKRVSELLEKQAPFVKTYASDGII